MTIGWDRRMKPYQRPSEIPPERIAVSADIFEDRDNDINDDD